MHSLISSLLSFDETLKLRVHIIQIALILLAIILSIARVTIRNPPATRANTVAITMGLKSLIVIAYQLLTEHRARFRKWASTKANAILNGVEVVFWLAVLVVTGMGVGRASGAAAALSALTLVLAIALELLSIWMAGCSIKVHRRAKASAAYGVRAAAAPTYVQSRPKSHAYPPAAMQERRFGA